MMLFRDIVVWAVQALLFCLGIGMAGLGAHLASPLIAGILGIDGLIAAAVIFFAVVAALGWIGNRFWPAGWMHNPLL